MAIMLDEPGINRKTCFLVICWFVFSLTGAAKDAGLHDLRLQVKRHVQPAVMGLGVGNAAEHELNWMVSIQVLDRGELVHVCGGSLLSKRLILTAAHCLYYQNTILIEENRISIKGGSHDYRKDSEPVGINYVLKYPAYERSTSNYSFLRNDIAILRMSKPVKVNTVEQGVVGLPARGNNTQQPNAAFIAGWGNTARILSNGSLEWGRSRPNILQKGRVDILSQAECQRRVLSMNITITDKMICTDSTVTDVCQGDSGSALFEEFVDETDTSGDQRKKHRILGIVSASTGRCRELDKVSLFTRVSSYLDDFILPALGKRTAQES